MSKQFNPLLPFGLDESGSSSSSGGGGGSSLSVQDILKDQVSPTTLYTGIANAGTALSATWTLLKYVLTGNDLTTRQVYTASDSWNNRLVASYVLSNSYSV